MGFWSGMIIGLFVGGMFGVLIMSIMVAGKREDELRGYNDDPQSP